MLFTALLAKILPLYAVIFLGAFIEKRLDIAKKTISSLLIYVFSPAAVFLGTYQAGIRFDLLSLPVIFFCVGSIFCLILLFIAGYWYKDNTEKILAFTAGTGNTGYFGIPVCLAVLGENALSVAVFITLGIIVFENTVGFFVVAKSSHSNKEALLKVLKLPAIYAFIFGIFLNIFHIHLPAVLEQSATLLKNGYLTFGILLIGLGLGSVKLQHIDFKFLASGLFIKFVLWPLVFFGIIFVDKLYFHFYNDFIHQIIIIESLVPIAANTVAYATELKAHPEKAAVLVFISTIIALFYIPLMLMLFSAL